jgi:hypothetical protein
MELFRTVGAQDGYGPLQANFSYDVRSGYTALVGTNNAGKSALLQLIFRDLMGDGTGVGPDRIAFILPDREYVQPTTETGGRTLRQWNQSILNELAGGPLAYGAAPTGVPRSEQARLLLHGNFIKQNQVHVASDRRSRTRCRHDLEACRALEPADHDACLRRRLPQSLGAERRRPEARCRAGFWQLT